MSIDIQIHVTSGGVASPEAVKYLKTRLEQVGNHSGSPYFLVAFRRQQFKEGRRQLSDYVIAGATSDPELRGVFRSVIGSAPGEVRIHNTLIAVAMTLNQVGIVHRNGDMEILTKYPKVQISHSMPQAPKHGLENRN